MQSVSIHVIAYKKPPPFEPHNQQNCAYLKATLHHIASIKNTSKCTSPMMLHRLRYKSLNRFNVCFKN